MSDACPRCDGPIGCVECSPVVMRLRSEGRRLRMQLEESAKGEAATPPSATSELDALRAENAHLRKELESSGKALAGACWPHDHARKDLPEDVQELHEVVRGNLEQWEDAKRAAVKLRQDIRLTYSAVIAEGKASKKSYVFQMGLAVDGFLNEWLT